MHVECPVEDAVIPKLSIVGASMGGIDHLGADMTNVTVYLPKDSNEVWVTVRLNGLGRADPTIEKNSTWVRVNIFSDKEYNARALVPEVTTYSASRLRSIQVKP
jgi:hypothetical protein